MISTTWLSQPTSTCYIWRTPRLSPRRTACNPYRYARANAALARVSAELILLLSRQGRARPEPARRMVTFLGGVTRVDDALRTSRRPSWCKARPARSTLVLGLVFAALFRVAPLTTDGRYLSTDLYRYIWDGRVQASGTNPFRYVPGDYHAPGVARRKHAIPTSTARTTRRPFTHSRFADALFLLCTRLSETVTDMRLTMVFFEGSRSGCSIRALIAYGLPAQRVFLYAWHTALRLGTRRRRPSGRDHARLSGRRAACPSLGTGRWRAGFALGCAVLTKLYPIILFPAYVPEIPLGLADAAGVRDDESSSVTCRIA